MNTASRRVAVFVLLALAVLAALACALVPSLVEDAAHQRLAELPAALANQGIALEPPEVEKVSFSLLSRELALDNVRLHGKFADAARSGGSFLATAEGLSLRLTPRALLLATPLGSFLLPGEQGAPELFPVAENVVTRDVTASAAETDLALTVSASGSSAEEVAVDSALLRGILTGAQAPSGPDVIDWLYAFAASGLRLDGIALSVDAPATGESLSASCAEFLLRGLERRHLAEQEARDIRCTLPDGRAFSIASLGVEAVALPEKALLRPLAEELARPRISEARLQTALKAALSGPEPLAGKSTLSGLEVPLAGYGEGEALRLERGAFSWRAVSPLDQEVVIEGLSLPAAALAQEVGIALEGLPTLSLNAELAVHGTGAGASAPERYSGNLEARSLCSLGYAFTLDPQGYAAELAVLRGTYSGATLKYTDAGLLPRLAAAIMPSAEAAMMAIKVGLSRFCSAPTPENAALRAALETFVERPGTLTLTARAPFNLLEALVTVGEGNAGALIGASAEPGPLSLGQAMRQVENQGR